MESKELELTIAEAQEALEKEGIYTTADKIRRLCKAGKVEGARKCGTPNVWRATLGSIKKALGYTGDAKKDEELKKAAAEKEKVRIEVKAEITRLYEIYVCYPGSGKKMPKAKIERLSKEKLVQWTYLDWKDYGTREDRFEFEYAIGLNPTWY